MERQTSLFFIGVILSVCFATVLGDYIIADFEERRDGDEYGYTTGTLYYYFDAQTRTNSRLRLEYTFGVSNLYDYSTGAMYSMCSDACTGIKFSDGADPWYKDNNFYTKTNQQEDGMYWYTRTNHQVTDTAGKQVLRILMNEGNSGNSVVKKIDFADGRHLTLSNMQHQNNAPSVSFSPDASLNCPKATCPIYADLIFVLDNSNSVKESGWTQTVNFVKGVMDSFTFGSDAVEAAVIHFNGGYYQANHYICPSGRNCYWSGCNKPSWCNKNDDNDSGACSDDYVYNNYAFPGYATATVFAGKQLDNGNMTVTSSAQNIKNNLNKRPDKIGDTCQGWGLELAKRVLENSPRRAYEKKPQAIVIAVTDGEDHCPNKTARAAKELKENFGAFLIEIGVGMHSSCNDYHKKFLQSLASYVGSEDNAAYYDVTNYAAIHTVTEKLFKPLCSNFSSQCGPDCHGFCGCGKCMCPYCDNSGSSCLNVTCLADGIASTGCQASEIPCPDDTKCVSYVCNGNKQGSERCEEVDKCAQMRIDNPQTCRKVECDNVQGCQVKYRDSVCKDLFAQDDNCVTFKCATSDSDITPGYEESGCQLVTNNTLDKLNELIASGKIACIKPLCDSSNGYVYEIDTCEPNPDSCDPVCQKVGDKQYSCVDTAPGRGPDTVCSRYECNSVTKEWDEIILKTTAMCKEEFIHGDPALADEYRCKNISCSPAANGCVAPNLAKCDELCTQEIIAGCDKRQLDEATPEQCFNVSCVHHQKEPEVWEGICAESEHINCYDDAGLMENMTDINVNNGTYCCSVVCVDGGCALDCAKMPYNRNKCLQYVCTEKSQGKWEWDLVDSNETTNCFSNGCWERACVPSEGCVNMKEICEVQSDECFNFTCDLKTLTCVNTSMLEETTCTKEICVNGEKKVVEVIGKCNLNETYKCLDARCEYDPDTRESECIYVDKPKPGSDPCTVYTCDNSSGDWSEAPKCDDGKYCTENVCTIFGECKFPDVTCSELSMDNYDCFERRCRENPSEQTYKCWRKIIGYVDVCGNCIITISGEFDIESFNSTSSYSSSSEYVDNCANGGPRPLLTEGLAAASIALIILAALVIGAGVAASGVMGTKTLISRAKGAENTSAHTNPLFENSDTEMTNPAFAGTAI